MKTEPQARDQYTAFARCYDVVMRDVDYESWARYVLDLCDRFHFPRQSLLNVACGTGNLEPLLREWFDDLVGFDVSEAMAARAREKSRKKGLAVPVHVGSMDEFDAGRTFDVVLCLYDSLNYVTDEKKVEASFRRAFEHLNPGGGYIFDITTEYNIIQNFAQYTFAETFKDMAYIWENRYDIVSKLAVSDFTFFEKVEGDEDRYQRHQERHVQKMYGTQWLKAALERAGFEFLAMYDGFTLNTPKKSTERIHFVARKK